MNQLLPMTMFLIGLIFIVMFLYSMLKQRNRLSSLFSIMCLLLAVYTYAYGMELSSKTLEQIKFFLKLEYFGFSFLPVLWVIISYRFYFNKCSSFVFNVLISIIPFITLFLSATNDYHGLYYADISLVRYNGYVLASITKGFWYYIFSVYSFICLLYGIGLFFNSWRHSNYSLKTQSFWMLLGGLFPAIANAAYNMRVEQSEIDVTAFSFLALGIAFFIALFCYDFLELKEIVRGYAFGQINEGIFVLDEENRIIDYNNSGQATFNWLNSQNIGKSILSFDEGKIISGKENNFFEVQVNKNGETKYYEFRVSDLMEKGKIVGRVYLFQDVTEQKLAISRLNYLATHDTLSEIYNRNKLMEEAEKTLHWAQQHCSRFSIIMVDIDHFKCINDKFGHIAGDIVLKSVAQSCKSLIRSIDIIGRYGGEEFVIILPEAGSDSALTIAEKIRKFIENKEFIVVGQHIKITVSIGVVSIEGNKSKTTVEELINTVDKAMYSAKNSGRNTVCIF